MGKYKAKNYAPKNYTESDVLKRIKTYGYDVSDVDGDYISQFQSDLNSYIDDYGKNADLYGQDAKKADDGYNSRTVELRTRVKKIEKYLQQNKNDLDKDTYNQLSEFLNNANSLMSSTNRGSYSRASINSKYASKTDYNIDLMNGLSGMDGDTSEARQSAYEYSVSRLGELENLIKNETDKDKKKALKDERKKLKAGLKQYERMTKVYDDYSGYQNEDDYEEKSKKRDYKNDRFEDVYDKASGKFKGEYSIDDPLGFYKSGGGVGVSMPNAPMTGEFGRFLDFVQGAEYGDYFNYWKKGTDNYWNKLTDEEEQMYYYVLAKQGKDKALEYLDRLAPQLGKRQNEELYENVKDSSIAEKAAFALASVPANQIGGFGDLETNIYDIVKNGDINPYSKGHAASNFAKTVREEITNEIINSTNGVSLWNVVEKLGMDESLDAIKPYLEGANLGLLFNAVMSSADSVTGALITGGDVYSTLAGLTAAGNRAMKLYGQGADIKEIIAEASWEGVNETIFEYLSIGRLIKNVGAAKTLGEVLKQFAIQGAVEASEEVATSLSNAFADYAIRGSQSDIGRNIQNYTSKGSSKKEAIGKALKDFSRDLWNDALAGFISGGLMGGATNVASAVQGTYQNYQNGRNIIADNGTARLYTLAKEQAANQYTGKRLSQSLNKTADNVFNNENARNVGKLSNLVESVQDKADVKAIQDELVSGGFSTRQAKNLADIVYKSIGGQTLSEDEQSDLRKATNSKDKAKSKTISRMLDESLSEHSSAMQTVEKNNREYLNARYGLDLPSGEESNVAEVKSVFDVSDNEGTIAKQTGESIEISNVSGVDASNNDLVLKLKDGNTIKASDVSFANKDEAYLYSSVAEMGVSVEAANMIITGYNGDIPVLNYTNGMKEAYIYGYNHYAYESLPTDTFIADLPTDLKARGLEAGRIDSLQAEKRAEARKAKTVSAKKKTSARGNYANNTKGGDKSLDVLYEALAKKTGVNIEKVKSIRGGTANASYIANAVKVQIASDAQSEVTDTIHELGHFVSAWSNEKYQDVSSAIFNWYIDKYGYADYAEAIEHFKSREGLSYSEAVEEFTNESIAGLFYKEGGAEDFVEWLQDESGYTKAEQKTILQKLVDMLKDIIDSIKTVLKTGRISSTAEKAVQMEMDKAQEIRKQFLAALDEASKNTNKKTATEDGVKYSLKGEFSSNILENNKIKVASMSPVANLKGTEFKKSDVDLTTQVSRYFDSIGNVVHSKYGDIILNRAGVKSSIAHGIGRNKAVAFMAVADVIEKGEIIDYQSNWKGRGYDTAVIAAPINIYNDLYYLASVIRVEKENNSYYLHEIALKKKEDNAAFKTGTINKDRTPSATSPSIHTLLQDLINVNTESKKYSLKDDEYLKLAEKPEENKAKLQQMVDEAAREWGAITDSQGNPTELYHGTFESFNVFDLKKTAEANAYGKGHYFTNDRNDAKMNYASSAGGDVQTKIESLAFYFFEEMGHVEEDAYDNEYVDDWNKAYDKAEEYYKDGKIISAYLKISNPLYVTENGGYKDKYGKEITEDEAKQAMAKKEYDGIIDFFVSKRFSNVQSDLTTHYVVLNPNQIKSADPVTYDNDGNVIPLSERFNEDEVDIRYSVKDKKWDSEVADQSNNIDNSSKKRNNKRSYYNEQESLFMQWSNSRSTEIGSTKAFTRFGKQHFYEKTESGVIEISKTQFYEKGEQIYEENYGRTRRSVHANSDRNGNEQRGHDSSDSVYGYAGEDERNPLYIQEERLQDDLAGNIQRRRTDSEEVRLNDDDKLSQKDITDVDAESVVDTSSTRYILSEALKGTTLNAAERENIEKYQQNVEELDRHEQKLRELKSQIKEMSFSSGKRDMQKLRSLKEEATKTENRIAIYDKKLTRIESMKPVQQVIAREKSIVRTREKQKAKEDIQKYRERSAAREQQIREQYRESRQRAKVRREETGYRARIRKIRAELEKELLRPTDTSYVPYELASSMVDVCKLISFDTDNDSKAQARRDDIHNALARLKTHYDLLADNGDADLSSEYDSNLSNMIGQLYKQLEEQVKDKRVIELSLAQLQSVHDILVEINETLRDARKQIGLKEAITNAERGLSIIDDMSKIEGIKGKGKGADFLNTYADYSLNTMRAVRRMVHYNADSQLLKAFYEMNRGQRKANKFIMTAHKLFEPLTTGKNQKKYTDAKTKVVDFGGGIKMTKMAAMQYILTWEREEHSNGKLSHLLRSGAKIADPEQLSKGNVKKAVDGTHVTSYHLTADQVQGIFEKMDEWDIKYMDKAREFFNVIAKNAVNETTRILKHRDVATSEFYIPYTIDVNELNQEITDMNAINSTISNMGILKSTVNNASQALIFTGLDQVIEKHINDVAKISGLAIPIRNFNKVWNYGVKAKDADSIVTVKGIVNEKWGRKGTYVIEQAVKDLQGNRKSEDSLWDKDIFQDAHSAFVGSALLYNVSVAMKQAASLMVANNVLEGRIYYSSAELIGSFFATAAQYEKITQEIDEHTATHWRRRQGLSTQELGDMRTSKGGFAQKLDKIPAPLNGMKWIQYIDCVTTATFWNKCKADVVKTNPGIEVGSDEYWELVTDKYDRLIEETQPMYDVLHRPEALRTKKVLYKTIAMFKTQPLQNAGMLYDAYGELKATGSKQARKKFVRTVASQMSSAIVLSLATLAGNALRHKLKRYKKDDEDETMFLKRIGLDSFESIFGVLMPIGGSEAYDIIEKSIDTYKNGKWSFNDDDTFSVPSVEFLNGIIGDITKLFDTDNWSDERKIYETLGNVLTDGFHLFGVPAKNIKNFAHGIIDNVKDIVNGEYTGFGTDESNTAPNVYKLVSKGEDYEEAFSTVVSYLIGEGKSKSEAESTAKSQFVTGVGNDYVDGVLDESEIRTMLKDNTDLTEAQIDNKLKEWDFEINYGFNYSNIDEEYRKGNIDRETMIEAIADTEQISREEAEIVADYYEYKTDSDSPMTKQQYIKWNDEVKDTGISTDVYSEYLDIIKDCKGTDSDGDGKTDSGSVKKEKLEAIDYLPVTSSQKDALYFLNGWSESKLYEAPWH